MSTNSLRLAVAPHDHTRFCDSVVGLAGKVLTLLSEPRTLDELLALLRSPGSGWPGNPSFGQTSLAVTLLYAIGAAQLGTDDRIRAAS